ncbi:hypothetical protein [Streptomyces sp. NPDC058304]|uniref:hypothetical protein n=1 Tax=Streptomyces sp. NPDC058304 TaxID=3346437 RepID=UPI0036EC8F07
MADVQALRAKVEKLRAEAEKKVNPLAQAEAALAEAEADLAVERKERAKEFDQDTVSTWEAENRRLHGKYDDAIRSFGELLLQEPWFQAFVEARTANRESFHLIQFATNATVRTTGHPIHNPHTPGGVDSPLLSLILQAADLAADGNGADYADELERQREHFISGEA